jgi:hypothetical protein
VVPALILIDVYVCELLCLHQEAVKLALSPDCNDLELAKQVAEMPTEDDEFPQADKKKIWLLIARHIVEHQQGLPWGGFGDWFQMDSASYSLVGFCFARIQISPRPSLC